METMRDESSLMIIEKEMKRQRTKGEKNVVIIVQFFCVELQSPEVLKGKPLLSRERRQGMSRRKRRRGNPEDLITLKKLMHIMLVMLATVVVTSVMVVMLRIAMNYLVTCHFTETRRTHLQELP